MRLIKTLAAGALLSSLSLACAAGTTLTFEGVGDLKPVGDFYKDEKIFFSSDALSVVSVLNNGSGFFKNAPSGSTALALVSAAGNTSFTVNVGDGFTSELELWFSTQRGVSGAIRLYGKPNGEGPELTDDPLTLGQVSQTGCIDPDFGAMICQWRKTSISFQGTARSLVFSSDADGLLFIDDMRFGAADPGNNVPEPASLALALAAAGAAALTRRRRVAAKAA